MFNRAALVSVWLTVSASTALGKPELHVYLAASVPLESDLLEIVQDEVDAIYRAAGFHVVWLDAAPHPARPYEARAYVMDRLPPSLRSLMTSSRGRAPMAITLGPRPTTPGADIYISRRAVLAQAGRREPLAVVQMGRAFGRTLAHELAHRFLKSGHTSDGILRATLSRRDLIDWDSSDLFLTSEQVHVLEEVAKR